MASIINNTYLFLQAVLGGKKQRYEARYEVLRFIVNWSGFRIYNKNLIWHRDQEYINARELFPVSASRIHERHFTLYYLAKSISQLPGDTAECGAYDGAGSHLILQANKASHDKVHHVFDSFEGLSKPADIDLPKQRRVRGWKQHDLSVSEQKVRENLSAYDNVKYYKGWIPDNFHLVDDISFSFVHIDVDLYQPTLDSLNFFYHRLNKGGLLVCDDYGSEQCPGAYKAYNEFIADKPENIAQLTTGTAFIIKQ